MKVKPDIFTLLRTGHFHVALTNFYIFCCPSNVIMSGFSKMKMSGFSGKVLFHENGGGPDGKGHYRNEFERD